MLPENPARARILEGDVWRALKSLKAKLLHDSRAYCWSSLGLGNIPGAEILEADVWEAPKSPAYCWPSLGLGNTARAEILEPSIGGALKSQPFFVLP